MVKVVISQPTFLPFYGYFKLMQEADVFVFLDNVQFSKQSWQQRNKVQMNGKDHWLTLPITTNYGEVLNKVKVGDVNKLKRTLSQQFKYELKTPNDYLTDINMTNIKAIKNKLNIDTKIALASEIGKTDIVEICKHLKATDYLSTGGSKVYFDDELENRFMSAGISVEFKEFEPDYSIISFLNDPAYLKRRGLI